MMDRPEIFHDLLLEALEDAGLLVAISAGESSFTVNGNEIDSILEGCS